MIVNFERNGSRNEYYAFVATNDGTEIATIDVPADWIETGIIRRSLRELMDRTVNSDSLASLALTPANFERLLNLCTGWFFGNIMEFDTEPGDEILGPIARDAFESWQKAGA